MSISIKITVNRKAIESIKSECIDMVNEGYERDEIYSFIKGELKKECVNMNKNAVLVRA